MPVCCTVGVANGARSARPAHQLIRKQPQPSDLKTTMRASPFVLLLISAAAMAWQEGALAQQATDTPLATHDTMIKPGGAIAELANRSALRAYAVKIVDGSITADEVVDYLVKGGSYQREKSYDRVHDFFVGGDQASILRYFIDGPRGVEGRLPVDRLKSLKILLDVGADPNLAGPSNNVGGENLLSPTLFAAAGNDLEALKLLVSKGASLEQREEKYLGMYGPALALATRADVLDFLLDKGAKVDFTDENGSNLLLLAVERTGAPNQVGKIAWLLDRGVSPRAPNQWKDTAETRAKTLLEVWDERLKENKDRLNLSLRELASESWAHLQISDQAIQARRREEAQALQAAHNEETAYLQAIQKNLQTALKLFAARHPSAGKP